MSHTHDDAGASAHREPPTTGHADLDAALLSVAELEERTLAEQLGALTEAHERVNAALAAARRQPATQSQPSGPDRPHQ